ncbi:FAD-binding oxidoreductase [Candidatus Woesearchaeota archaeon]|nr:FAD-binding oxidoreductase [Candidatus Woesearchaeota archaeon]
MEQDLKKRMGRIVGEGNVSDSANDRLTFATDASQIEGKASLVVWPTSAEQVHRIIVYANRHDVPLVLRGSGTGLSGGAVPDDSVVVSFVRMDRILRINLKERWAEVEPGVILDDLNAVLRRHGLYFPVVPSSHEVASVGGVISTDAVGVRGVKYGRASDWIEELTVIDGTGKPLVLKKDRIRDFAGSEGVCGAIIGARLRLAAPLGRTTATLHAFGTMDDLIFEYRRIMARQDVTAVEFWDRTTARLLGMDERHYLFVEFESDAGKVKDASEIARLWKRRDAIAPTLGSKGFTLLEDPKVPLEELPTLIGWLSENGIPAFGHIGYGIVHPRFPKEKKDLIPKMFRLVKEIGGEVTGEHGIGIYKKEFVPEGTVRRIRELKRRYDPKGIINRGKIV